MATTDTTDQIKSIHQMLESGHKSVQLERHTLALWGISIASLILFMEYTFRPPYDFDWIPNDWLERQLVIVAIVTVTMGIVIWLDTRLTAFVRKKKDHTVSFIQQRLRYIYWMIVFLFVLFGLGTIFYGGGEMVYSVGIILVGMAFFIQGLFSQQMLCWAGALIILSGILIVLFDSPLIQMSLAASVFGIGLPLLGWMIAKDQSNISLQKRIAGTAVWTLTIIISTWSLNTFFGYREKPDTPRISYEEYSHKRYGKVDHKEFIVDIPTGTTIPVLVELRTNLTNFPARARMELKLAEDVQLAVDQKKDIFYKYGDNPWLNKRWHEDKIPKIYGFFFNRYFTDGQIYLRYDF